MIGQLNTKGRRCLAVLPRLPGPPQPVKLRPLPHKMVAKRQRPARKFPLQHLLLSAKVRKKRNAPELPSLLEGLHSPQYPTEQGRKAHEQPSLLGGTNIRQYPPTGELSVAKLLKKKEGRLLYRISDGAQTQHLPADVSMTTAPGGNSQGTLSGRKGRQKGNAEQWKGRKRDLPHRRKSLNDANSGFGRWVLF